MKKIFLVRFNHNRMYINSYKQLFKSDLKIISGFLSILKILFLPLKAKVIIEDIHIYWYLYIIRFDLIIIHIPRGGCTFKIGWKDSNPPLRIKLKLWRRNYVVIASDFFRNFFLEQEFMKSYQRIIVCAEPILEIEKKKYSKNNAIKTLLMLGDRATKDDYKKVLNSLSEKLKKNLVLTIHPRLNFKIDEFSSSFECSQIRNVITDGSISSAILFTEIGASLYVIKDYCFSRELWNNKSEFYDNMSNLNDISNSILNNNKTLIKFNISTDSLRDEL